MAGIGQKKATPGPKMGFPSAQAAPSPPTHVYAVGRLPLPPPSLCRNRRLIYERSRHKLNEKSSAGEIIDDPVASACRLEGAPTEGRKKAWRGREARQAAGRRRSGLARPKVYRVVARPIYKSSSRCLLRSRSVATVDRPLRSSAGPG